MYMTLRKITKFQHREPYIGNVDMTPPRYDTASYIYAVALKHYTCFSHNDYIIIHGSLDCPSK